MRFFVPTCLAFTLALSACNSSLDPFSSDNETYKPKLEGERVAVLRQDAELKADESVQSTPIELEDAIELKDWPQHAGSESGYATTLTLSGSLEDEDSATIGDGADFEHGVVVSPVISDGIIFVMDAEGNISAHRTSDIDEVIWSYAGVANADETAMISGGLAVHNSALFAVSGNGLVASFDAGTGRELWRQDIRIPVRAAPLAVGSKLYIVTTDSKLFALDTATGDIIWDDQGLSEGASYLANAAPVAYNGLLAVPYASAELRILTADEGRQLWSDVLALTKRNIAASNFSGIGGAPVIFNNAIYAVSTAGLLSAYRFDNGMRIWEQPLSSANRPWISGNTLFVLTTDNQLVALNRYDGRIYWVNKLPSFENEKERLYPYSWKGPVLAGDVLYIAGGHGVMKRISAIDGKAYKDLDIPDGVLSNPIIANGVMYLVSKDATLHALK